MAKAPTPAIFPLLMLAAPVNVEAAGVVVAGEGLTAEDGGGAVVAGALVAGSMLVQPEAIEYETVVGMPQVEVPLLYVAV